MSRPGAQAEPDWWEPVITRPDPVPLAEWLAADADEDEPPGFGEDDLDPEGSALDTGEARHAERQVLGQAPSLSPGRLRGAIKGAVAAVAPGKAKERREHGARNARVGRWAEDSGNAGLAVREAPPARVLAADQRITWRARQLKAAGVAGGMDVLRARAALDRYQASGHDPGARLRHLTTIRHATCTAPMCARPSGRADFEHDIPYGHGGRTCLCNTGPKCRHDHQLKQDPRWTAEQHPGGTFTWTTPSGRQYTTGPTEYPI